MRTGVNYSGIYTSASIIDHLATVSPTVALCAYLLAADGTKRGVTSHTQDITGLTGYASVTFRTTGGILPSKASDSDQMKASDIEADMLLSAAGITAADVLAGRWTNAFVRLFLLNYETPTMGQAIIPPTGYVAEIQQMDQVLRLVVHGYNNALLVQIVNVTRPECKHKFGDSGCTLDLTALGYVKTGTLTSVTSQTVFIDTSRTESADYFTNGLFQFTSVTPIGFARCIYINLGWNVRALVDDNVQPKPDPYQATFVFSPRISGFR